MPVTVRNSDRRTTGNTDIPIWHIFIIRFISKNTTLLICVESRNNDRRTIIYIKITFLIEVHAASARFISRTIERKRCVFKYKIGIIYKISSIATTICLCVCNDILFNNLNILECHISLIKPYTTVFHRNLWLGFSNTLNRQSTFFYEGKTAFFNGNILTNFNRIAVLRNADSFFQSFIRLSTNLRNKRLCRRRRSRSRLTAAVRAAVFALLLISSGCIVTAAVAVVSGFLYILGVIAAVVSRFLYIIVAAVCLNIYIVIHSLLTVLIVAYHVYNIIRGVGCSIIVRAFLRRQRGNRQHGQHHQSGEGTGKKTVISLFHAKNLLYVHTDAKEA